MTATKPVPVVPSVLEQARSDAVKAREAELLKALRGATEMAHESNSIQMTAVGGVRFRLAIYGEVTPRLLRSICTLLNVNADVLEEDDPVARDDGSEGNDQ